MPTETTTKSTGLSVLVGGFTCAGIKPENQDAFGAYTPETSAGQIKGAIACIADGVSCSDQAALASRTSVNTFVSDYLSTPESWSVSDSVSKVLSSLNSWLYSRGQTSSVRENGLVTTFSTVVFKSNTAYGFHVGDSRIYRWRKQQLEQLTRDHQIGSGEREVLTRALGMDTHLEVDFFKDPLETGDLYLLSTDGVHHWVNLQEFLARDEWQFVLRKPARSGLERLAKAMVDEALAAGSQDNLTCLLVFVKTLPELDLEEVQQRLTEKVFPPAMEPGNRIDSFEVERILHMGTRSTVYRVRELGTARRFAMKVPGEKFAEDLNYLESFQRECWIAQRVSHPSLLKAHVAAQESHFLYQLYEYVDGPTLRQWMHDHPSPSLDQVRKIIEPLIAALRALQRRGMVHRDLKPENIILPPNAPPVIIDYGTVQVAGLKELVCKDDEDIPEGSADYIAPEYILENSASSTSDLFSLAVITYEMLVGKLPFQFSNMAYRLPKSFDEWRYQSITHERKDLPLWLDLAMQKALEPRPSKRHQAFSEFQRDLRQANPDLLANAAKRPLMERNPIVFWQSLSALLGTLALFELYLLIGK